MAIAVARSPPSNQNRPAMLQRRKLITGLISLVAAPSIVRAASLMPVKGDVYRFWTYTIPMLHDPLGDLSNAALASYFGPNNRLFDGIWTLFGKDHNIYSDKVVAFEKRESIY